MNQAQIAFLAIGMVILVAVFFGILLDRAKKPYGKLKLVIHLFFVAWLTLGVVSTLFAKLTMIALIPVGLMGLMILSQLTTGILMLTSTKQGKLLPRIHLSAAILIVLADACAFIISGIS